MRSEELTTQIFLDGGDPAETGEIIELLGFLDGQTTNPTLVSKNPEAQRRLKEEKKFTSEELLRFYKTLVQKLSAMIPEGSISIEVYADKDTSQDKMFSQGKEMFTWISNAHIKYPTTSAGLSVASASIAEGMRVNMTLVFTQQQAAAVYAATEGASRGDVFVSPFIGRIDDRGENGMNLIKNILKMYDTKKDRHVEVLTASVRSLEHFMAALALKSDIITAPAKILRMWAQKGMPLPDTSFSYEPDELTEIPYQELVLGQKWEAFDIKHELTDAGVERFANDWNQLVE